MTKALTIGVIAERVGQPVHVVEYIIRARRIRPTCRAGIARVFAEQDVAFIADEIAKIHSRRQPQSA